VVNLPKAFFTSKPSYGLTANAFTQFHYVNKSYAFPAPIFMETKLCAHLLQQIAPNSDDEACTEHISTTHTHSSSRMLRSLMLWRKASRRTINMEIMARKSFTAVSENKGCYWTIFHKIHVCNNTVDKNKKFNKISWKFAILFNPLTPNDPYRGRTAPLASKRCILYIYSTNIGTEYFKHGVYSFFSSKCSLFHNSNFFGSCIIHILYTGCAKIKKIIPAPNG